MRSIKITQIKDGEETNRDEDSYHEDDLYSSGIDPDGASVERLCRQCSRRPLGEHRLRHSISEAQDSGRALGRLARYWKQLWSGGQLNADTCVFCFLVKEALSRYDDDDERLYDVKIYIDSMEGEDAALTPLLFLSPNFLSTVGPWLSVEFAQENSGPTQRGQPIVHSINARNIDWNTVRRWMNVCDVQHSDCDIRGRTNDQSWQGFQVIDCKTRQIGPLPPHAEYVALSYVWGSSPPTKVLFNSEIEVHAPQTIEDAIICTQAMGLRYLWIDRYCINQTNSSNKHDLIQHMGEIYQNASITVINAAGEGSHCGLPGVSIRTRRLQSTITIDGVSYSTIPDVRRELGQSVWSTRGWTYQEGLLSGRRLVFSQDQISFQCLSSCACEAFPKLRKVHDSEQSWSADGQFSLNFNSLIKAFPTPRVDQAAADVRTVRKKEAPSWIIGCINEYVLKTLSYDSDTLDAFMGVLRQAWTMPDPAYHFYGLPFVSDTVADGPLEANVLAALFWSPWLNDVPVLRRERFPSWTWAGWQKLAGFIPSRIQRLEGAICFEDVRATRVSLQDYMERMTTTWDMYEFKPILHVTGWFTLVGIRLFAPWSDRWFSTCGRELLDNDMAEDEIVPLGDVHFLSGGPRRRPRTPRMWPVVTFREVNKDDNIHGLLLEQTKNNSFEVVGRLKFKVQAWPSSGSAQVNESNLDDSINITVSSCIRRIKGAEKLGLRWRTIKLV